MLLSNNKHITKKTNTNIYGSNPFFTDLFLNVVDQSTVDKNTEKFLDEVVSTLGISNFKHWFFGHYHDDRTIHNKFTMLYNNVVELGDYIGR